MRQLFAIFVPLNFQRNYKKNFVESQDQTIKDCQNDACE